MRLTLQLLGLELDITFGIAGDAIAEDDGGRDMGYTGGQFLSFTSAHQMPDEAAIHHQCSPYEDDSEAGHG
jgi:hypothetical protein